MKRPTFIPWRPGDRRLLLIAVPLTAVLVGLLWLQFALFAVIQVAGDSMAPALLNGDRVLMTRDYVSPEAGDIVGFTLADERGRTESLIKRVVAVPGDSVEVVGDSVYVNGELSAVAPTARVGTAARPRLELVVPDDSVFVLGDNRPTALDSRHFGPVPLETVEGKGIVIILPLLRVRTID